MRVQATTATEVDGAELHELLRTAYAFMDGRIDPPSSLYRMTTEDLRQKAIDETLVTARAEGRLVGCLFARNQPPWLYVGKVAVAVDSQGMGVGRALIAFAQGLAVERQLDGLELETRIELTENHAAFASMGFIKVADQSHDGYDRTTCIRMRAAGS